MNNIVEIGVSLHVTNSKAKETIGIIFPQIKKRIMSLLLIFNFKLLIEQSDMSLFIFLLTAAIFLA